MNNNFKKQSLVEVKKSKFLGFAFYIQTEAEVKEIIKGIKKEYKDARHVVYAYRLQTDNVLKEKFHNDKEPSGSAGQPLLYLLQKKEINNYLLLVIRYFGGTKLGVGALMRAYTQAGREALDGHTK